MGGGPLDNLSGKPACMPGEGMALSLGGWVVDGCRQ